MRDTVAARKYARALFAEAQKQNQLLACQQGLHEIARVARLRGSIGQVLTHPFISADDKKRMIHSALGEYSTPLLTRFLTLLIRKHRWDLLPAIVQDFQDEVDRSQSVQPLRVKVAYPLTEPLRKQLEQKLERWLGGKVRMEVLVDPGLIGGLVVQTRNKILDQSLKGQLKKLQQTLAG